MKIIKFVLPLMVFAFAASAETTDPNCRVYSPTANQGSVGSDGAWVPTAASAQG
jgi:hypothetical protein